MRPALTFTQEGGGREHSGVLEKQETKHDGCPPRAEGTVAGHGVYELDFKIMRSTLKFFHKTLKLTPKNELFK